MNWNGVGAYGDTDLKQLQESAGVTQFVSNTGWYQSVNGILFQGGTVSVGASTSVIVPFNVGIPAQLFGVFVQPLIAGAGNGYGAVDPAGTNLAQFMVVNTGVAKDYYWFAVGV